MATQDVEAEPGQRKPWYQTVHGPVFWPSAAILVAFVLAASIWPTFMYNDVMLPIQGWIVEWFASYYILLVSAFVVFALWVGLGHFGDIKLGKDEDKPEFSVLSWFAMLFAAGMGIGMMYYGVAEPLSHYAGVPNRAGGAPSGMTDAGVHESLVTTYLHWGLHPWAIYVVVGLAIAYAVHRKGKPISIRWTLEPVFGDRIKGWVGDVIDIVAVIGTLFGVATSLGLGVLQIGAGLSYLEVMDGEPSNLLYIILIGLITLMATLSVVTGVKKGIKWLSNFNIATAAIILFVIAVSGSSLFLLREFVESIGLYFQELLRHSFNTSALAENDGTAWQGWWTAFYWGWWISWAPFVGVFIARISKGRTVRQFVAAVLLVPTTVAFLWFTVFGGSALNEERKNPGTIIDLDENGQPMTDAGGANISVDTNSAMFDLFKQFPGWQILAGVAVILVVLFFVTSSDSGSLVVDMLSHGGDLDPPKWSRVFWAVMEGTIAAVLLTAGPADDPSAGLNALKYAAIIIALPFTIVMILMVISTLKQFRKERQTMLEIQRRQQREEVSEHVTQGLIEEGLVEPNGNNDKS